MVAALIQIKHGADDVRPGSVTVRPLATAGQIVGGPGNTHKVRLGRSPLWNPQL